MKEKLFILGNGVDWCEKSLEKVAASCYNGKRQNLRYLIIYVMEG